MRGMLDLACGMLSRGEGFVLVQIINRSGSAPRTAGARMLVAADGTIHGTIGGGRLEAEAIESSRQVWETGVPRFLHFNLNNANVAEMDMICGGSLEVLLDCIQSTEKNRQFFRAWQKMAGERRSGWAVSAIQGDGRRIERIERCLLGQERSIPDSGFLSDRVLAEVKQFCGDQAGKPDLAMITLDDTCLVIEPLIRPKTVFIFGAGHVARPTARMAQMVGFRVAVMDDRKEYANVLRFPEADQIEVLADFDRALDGLPMDEDSCIVILTRGHLHDKTVLAQALRSNAGYIGMIGSRRKRDAIYEALLGEGFSERDLKRVFSPIGLAIGAESPEEIALSIVAELVQQRAAGR